MIKFRANSFVQPRDQIGWQATSEDDYKTLDT